MMDKKEHARINQTRSLCLNHRSLRKDGQKMYAGLELIKMDDRNPYETGQKLPSILASDASSIDLAFGHHGRKIGIIRFVNPKEDEAEDRFLHCSSYALIPREMKNFFSPDSPMLGNGNILYAPGVSFYKKDLRSEMLNRKEILKADVLTIGRKFDPSQGYVCELMERFESELKRLFDLARLHGIRFLIVGDLAPHFRLGYKFTTSFGEILCRLALNSGIPEIALSLSCDLPDRKAFFWKAPIEVLNLAKPRPHNVWKRAGIDTIGQLLSMNEDKIRNKVRNMQKAGIKETKQALARLGLRFRGSEPV